MELPPDGERASIDELDSSLVEILKDLNNPIPHQELVASKEQNCSYYFKLFNSLKAESEVELAKLELQSIFGPVEEIGNFVDEFVSGELANAFKLKQSSSSVRIQDAITHELPYGKVQGFKGRGSIDLLPKLSRRLAYVREIYVISTDKNHTPKGAGLANGVNVFRYVGDKFQIIRAITVQLFLEKSEYISKLSRTVQEVDMNLATLEHFAKNQGYRIPATQTMGIGRRLEDWFAIREEPSLYLAHYLHPYKGKFHPKLARALINQVCPNDNGVILDNFSGSGTTLVEAQWLGLESLGVDINPLSALMSQVKVQCVRISPTRLKSAIEGFLKAIESEELVIEAKRVGQEVLQESAAVNSAFDSLIADLPKRVKRQIPNDEIRTILRAKEILHSQYGSLNGDAVPGFLLLGMSGAVSDIARRTDDKFTDVLRDRLTKLWLRVYLATKLISLLDLNIGKGECYVGDARSLSKLKTLGGKETRIENESIDGIVNSPPYSVALDYIRNDLPQLSLLGLVGDMDSLEKNLIGNPRGSNGQSELLSSISTKTGQFAEIPEVGQRSLKRISRGHLEKEAARTMRFWLDMKTSLVEMRRVLKPGGRAAIVIGDNSLKIEGRKEFERIPNIQVMKDLAKQVGLEVIEELQRTLEKTMSGLIRDESIVILEKPVGQHG